MNTARRPASPEPWDLERFEGELRDLVNIDSGPGCVAGVNAVTDWFAARYRALGWPVTELAAKPDRYGRSLFTWKGDPAAMDLLILCHSDTVFPDGTARAWPFSVVDGRYLGPGVADMKAGCLMALHVLEHLEREERLAGSVGVFLNGEHELGCPTTRTRIEELSQQAKVVVATEPARANGACVRQRKGILRYTLTFAGRSAHAGVNPESGICAVTAMAHAIVRLKGLEDRARGISVNPGLVSGGTSVNAVPDHAECRVDIRVVQQEDAVRVDTQVREMFATPTESGAQVSIEGGITRPPMVPTARGDELIAAINRIAGERGVDLQWAFSGGGSDASFAGAFGIPALCGLGPVGGGMHTENEYLEAAGLCQRIDIFSRFVEELCAGRI